MNVPKPINIPFPFPCLMCMCLGGVRVPTSGVNVGHVQCTVYACMMLFAQTHTDSVLTTPVAPDALLPADSEAVQTETNCPVAV